MHMVTHDRETQIAPGGHSAWSRAAIFTASPCRSVPSGIASPMLIPIRKRMARSGGCSHRGPEAPAAPSQHIAPHHPRCRTRRTANPHPSGRSCPPCSSMAGSIRSRRRALSRWSVPGRRGRSIGNSPPCRHTLRRPACADLAVLRSGLMSRTRTLDAPLRAAEHTIYQRNGGELTGSR